jgi:hypothetical protein
MLTLQCYIDTDQNLSFCRAVDFHNPVNVLCQCEGVRDIVPAFIHLLDSVDGQGR